MTASIKLAVNEHPYFVGITAPDYLVFMDDPAHNTRLMQAVANSYGFRVSPDLQYTNVDLRGMPEFYYRGSGIVAAWFACHLGCDPVILCGMDLYQGAQKYIHGDDDYQNLDVYRIPLEEHLRRWEPLRGFKQIRVIDSPLKKYFPVL